MKILLIQSHLGRTSENSPIYPIGLVYLANSILNHEVDIFDLNLWEFETALAMLKDRINNFLPSIIGISIRNIDTTQRSDIFIYFKTIKPTVTHIKNIIPETKIIAGGAGFSMFPYEIMNRIPQIDFGVFLEGEVTFTELIEKIDTPEAVKGIYYRKNQKVIFTGKRDLLNFSKVPIPSRPNIQSYISDEYNIGIQSKRGCLLNCSYCDYPFLSGKKIRYRHAKLVVDEIEYLQNMGVRKFSFVDNVFNVPVNHAKQICNELICRDISVNWSAWFDIKYFDKELLDLAKKAGCDFFVFSPDATTTSCMKSLNKTITQVDLRENIHLMKKEKWVKVSYHFFIQTPVSTLLDVLISIGLYLKLAITFRNINIDLSYIRIEPHTQIHNEAIKEQIIFKTTNLFVERECELSRLFFKKKKLQKWDSIIFNILNKLEKHFQPSKRF